jgi:DmsE family decaheme c-type cytochrome
MKKMFHRGAFWGVCAWAAFLAPAEARVVDWTAINPGFAGATYVRDVETCGACHEEVIEPYHKTAHGRAFALGPRNNLEVLNCEACHGPRSQHVQEPDLTLAMTDRQYEPVCLQCHQDSDRMYWQSSLHRTTEVNCTSCHTLMERRSDRALLSQPDESTLCYACHTNVRGEMHKTHRHPVRDNRMECSDCHNPHGSPGRGMLVKGTVNETCYSCHQEMRGPFLWEHPPVRENCLACHEPHGSNNPGLLITKGPSQCVTCHQYGGHINQFRYNRVSTPYGNGCVNCHVAIHGSNHPSGPKLTR